MSTTRNPFDELGPLDYDPEVAIGALQDAEDEAATADLPPNLVVGTMCHCGNPDGNEDEFPCDDHWEFFVDPEGFDPEDGTLRTGRHLTEAQMRSIAALVAMANHNRRAAAPATGDAQ